MTIKFVKDNGAEVGSYVPLAVQKMVAITKSMKDEIRPATWLLREACAESSNGKYLNHPLMKPYRMKCNVDGIQRVWVGNAKNIKAKKAEFDKIGRSYRD